MNIEIKNTDKFTENLGVIVDEVVSKQTKVLTSILKGSADKTEVAKTIQEIFTDNEILYLAVCSFENDAKEIAFKYANGFFTEDNEN